MSDKNVSDEFRNAFSIGGCSHATCNCGESHGAVYDAESDSCDDDCDGCIQLLFGAVDGCKCGSGPRHENWIWDNRLHIAEYLRERTKKEKAAMQDLENIELSP